MFFFPKTQQKLLTKEKIWLLLGYLIRLTVNAFYSHKFFLSIDYDFVYFEQTMGEKMLVEGKISFHLSRKTQFKSWNH